MYIVDTEPSLMALILATAEPSTGLRRSCYLQKFLVVLVLCLAPSFTEQVTYENRFEPTQLNALQALRRAWEKTPEMAMNLAGWEKLQRTPCEIQELRELSDRVPGFLISNESLNWEGVECMHMRIFERPESDFIIRISGLILHNASITGTLPEEIWNISTLSTIEITGNPNLTGNLPAILRNAYKDFDISRMLSNLDLHDNGFSGNISSEAFTVLDSLKRIDLSGNHFSGGYPSAAFKCKKNLQQINLANNLFTGYISNSDFEGNANLKYLNLSNNCFGGPIPDLSMIPTLQIVYLDNNNFSGTLDMSSINFSTRIKILSLTSNNIKSIVYNKIDIENFTTIIKLQGNPYCQGDHKKNNAKKCFCSQVCKVIKDNNSKNIIIMATSSSVASIIFITFIVGFVLFQRSKRFEQNLLLQYQNKFSEYDVKPTIFSYNQVQMATRDFHLDMKLGEGGFGAVYKGILSKGDIIAVKKLNINLTKEIDDFLNEVVLITGMKHRNLVNLKGCCLCGKERLLIYEYVENGDVEQALTSSRKMELNWPMRLNICIGVAHGLHYLHALAQPKIIHRDIKASNILLDRDFAPKIADFGIAMLFPDEKTHITTNHIAGTRGYMSHEYLLYGQISNKVDVYSFGVLCLEIMSGRKHIDYNLPLEQMSLANWAWNFNEQNRLMDLVDPTLHLHIDDRFEVKQAIKIALLCIQYDPKKRPSMAHVVAMLQRDMTSEVILPVCNREAKLSLMQRSFSNSIASSSTNLHVQF